MICVVELQILTKTVSTGDYSLIEDNLITREYFEGTGYEDEYDFISSHYEKYGNVPDKATFINKFPAYKKDGLPVVQESDKYLVDTIREEYLFRQTVPVIQRAAKLLKTDANAAYEYWITASKDLQPNYQIDSVDLIADGENRVTYYLDKLENQGDWYFSTGFAELDAIIHGIQRFEELFVLFARLGQGKSWVLETIVAHIWKMGFNVGYISPEMSPMSVGYRFDTTINGYSNSDLKWGLPGIDVEKYRQDIKDLKDNHTNHFWVSTPDKFGNAITVSKLRQYIKQYKLDLLAIDGIKYLKDERGRRNDNLTTSLTNISEDLMKLSVELKIPVLVVVQANREGAGDDVPQIENIRDSDGIAQNATKVVALRQADGNLEMVVEKHRDGGVGKKLKYIWNINKGEFIYTENTDNMTKEEKAERREKKKAKGADVF